MIGFTDILAFLALCVALGALYLVADAVKKVEGESRRLIEAQLLDVRKRLEKLTSLIALMEDKHRETSKTLSGLMPLLEEKATQINKVSSDVEALRARIEALDRAIPPKFRNPEPPRPGRVQ